MQTRLLLLGAGRSATSLIDYLLRHAAAENWHLTIADAHPAPLAPLLAAHPAHAVAVPFSAADEAGLDALVAAADLVVSMLPAALHPLVARACLRHRRHLATASYVGPEIAALHDEAAAAGLTFLMECGLDPGLDHMSAMRAIDHIRARGGRLTAFRSYCGGLLAPEAEAGNPWQYKFTWNPRNVVLAGQGTAKFLENNALRVVPYQHLFARTETLAVPGWGAFEGYANRDSLGYRAPYGLETIPTILRGTLRRPGYCAAWHALVRLGLTDDTLRLGNAAALPWAQLLAAFLPLPGAAGPGNNVSNNAVDEAVAAAGTATAAPGASAAAALALRLAHYLNLPPDGPEMTRLAWLGIFTDRPVGLPDATPAQLLEHLLTEKWALQPHDRDLIVMQHLFDFELDGRPRRLTASLAVLGTDARHTGMAQTVGLPLGMAVRRLLRGDYARRGVVIPTEAALYNPILDELAADYGIHFQEEETA